MQITHLGRFKTQSNKLKHQLAIAHASNGSWLLPPSPDSEVDMSNCVADLLGFCYTKPPLTVHLEWGHVYYVVSSEVKGEVFVNMTRSATGADYGEYRDGDTLMTYKLPSGTEASKMAAGGALVTGKVLKAAGDSSWVMSDGLSDLDTSYGPVNFAFA